MRVSSSCRNLKILCMRVWLKKKTEAESSHSGFVYQCNSNSRNTTGMEDSATKGNCGSELGAKVRRRCRFEVVLILPR